jgi:hypothetical protein
MGFSKGPVIVLDVSLLGTFDSLEGIGAMGFSKGPVIVLDVSLLGTFDSLGAMGFSKGPVIVLDVSLLGTCLINCSFIKFILAFAISDLPLSIAPTVSRISNLEL